ncbi:MAG TPA: CPBP family intramembrane glutamic endopeptidase [Nocardioides sp.]|uniref:CPBP family intramembrane glutamic endopeptidase n=1 Tax=Nocardioides sp. TaxID=35761 RepID=UPI002E31BE4B|nr:CPBP family intramembrane glutamic endopeptidase [Nocardioides sp.]HEX5086388.1 CPBP family intramembrane glutamic endopeptidase [Nocardioides sp.]
MTATPLEGRARRRAWWTSLAVVELAVAVAAILLDLAIPSLLILLLAGVSLAVRREGPSSLGLRRPTRHHLVAGTAAFAAVWSLFQVAVTMPVANHLSGERQDLGVFADVEGDVGLLLLLVALSWTLGAFVEEVAFRGFLLTRLREVLGEGRVAVVVGVLVSSVLFGVLHSEQGVVGVVVVALDGVAFCCLRLFYATLWASVLAHGFNNTLGLVTFFLVGPVYGFW